MKTIVLATGNPHKAEELLEILGDGYEVKTMGDMGIDIDIVEDGKTFEANALIKVRAIKPYLKDQNAIVMGDDSGLCVEALDGAPGIYSARYAGENVTYTDNNEKLLKDLAKVPESERGAKFVCSVAMIFPNGEEWVDRGEVLGQIALEYKGKNGFGYDPLFIVENTGLSYAEMEETQKNEISHRGRAVMKAKKEIERVMGN